MKTCWYQLKKYSILENGNLSTEEEVRKKPFLFWTEELQMLPVRLLFSACWWLKVYSTPITLYLCLFWLLTAKWGRNSRYGQMCLNIPSKDMSSKQFSKARQDLSCGHTCTYTLGKRFNLKPPKINVVFSLLFFFHFFFFKLLVQLSPTRWFCSVNWWVKRDTSCSSSAHPKGKLAVILGYVWACQGLLLSTVAISYETRGHSLIAESEPYLFLGL